MTSEAGRRPLHARLATSGTAKQPTATRGKAAPATTAKSATKSTTKSTTNATKATKATNGTSRNSADRASAMNGRGRETSRAGHPKDHELTVIAPAAPPAGPAARGASANDDPLAALLAEAQAAISDGANSLRDVRERYRAAYNERVEQLEAMRAWPTAAPGPLAARTSGGKGATGAGRTGQGVTGHDVGQERGVLNRIDLAAKSLENAWLFLAREDSSLVSDPSGPPSAADAQMRIVEAQEQERTRLAREVHDGPAQALSNAIFQVEVVQRLLDRDEQMARAELQQLRDVLTRELRGVRAYLSQLRPPLLADLGLSGAIKEAGNQTEQALNIPVQVELEDGVDSLPETVEVVALRVIQEALQNARKHAQASSIRVRMSKDGNSWAVEVRDDGKGFDSDDPPVSGRRHFGLQFMRERAELIGARFEVRSSPNLGTAVRMTIPPGAMGMPIPEGEV
ncbi:MAG TPA: sensor histidine kinase [Candidatus Limnocylindrales bacterium]|nr:sensor histidine kinase [Candidatus Limnocylindrales bacterium]